ncbi:MAG: PAS domain S-box protein [Ignavibacteriales bacterium]|nr:PAS domain S-box protein [Ignavibacteriales bacterium]
MTVISGEIGWALLVGTFVIVILITFVIALLLYNQRRFIKSQKQKLETLQQRDKKYNDLFNNVTDIIYIYSLEGEIVQINDAATRILGYEMMELVGKPLKQIVEKQHHSAVDKWLREAKIIGESEGQVLVRAKDGKKLFLEFRNSTVIENSRAIGIRGIARNITEQKEAERELRKSEKRFRSLVELSPVPKIVLGCEKILYCNQAGVSFLGGANQEEILQSTFFSFFAKDNQLNITTLFQNLINGNSERLAISEEIICLTGKRKRVEIIATPITFEGIPTAQVIFYESRN